MGMSYTPRLLEQPCRKALEEGKILVLTGARQTGKTTLIRHLLDGLPEEESLILNMDDPFLRDRLCSTEGALTRAVEDSAQRPASAIASFTLVLDEAQKAPELFEMIKDLWDSWNGRLRIALTGSSVLGLHDPVAESLAGRVRIKTLHPFTLCEGYAHLVGEDPTSSPVPEWMSALLCGRFTGEHFRELETRCRFRAVDKQRFVESCFRFPLFPEPCGNPTPEEWIRDYLATYIEKDIHALSSVGLVGLFRSSLRQLAAHVVAPVKWETMAQMVGTTSVTLRKYFSLMEQTLTAVRLSAYSVNPVTRVKRAPKLYLADQGILWGLRNFEDRHVLEATGMLGLYMESLAIAEVAKWCSLEPTAPELRFWSKTAVSEVDLVVSNRGYHVPFEIKLGQKVKAQWLKGLEAFEADHGHLGLQIPYRVILHMGEPERPDQRTFAMPLWALT